MAQVPGPLRVHPKNGRYFADGDGRAVLLTGSHTWDNLQDIGPLRIGENLKEVLECDLKAEREARELYTKAREICRKAEDYVSMHLFEDLLKDEEGHIDFLETQLDLIDRIGIQNYGQLQSDAANEAEGH